MTTNVQGGRAQSAYEERIRMLEQENARLCAELEQQQQLLLMQAAESDTRLRNAFQHAAIGYALADADGCYVDVNAAYCDLTGYSMEELRHISFTQLIHPDDREANLRVIRQLQAHEVPSFVIENRYVRKDGTPVWVRKSVSAIWERDDKPEWILVLVEDINLRKKAELELRQSEQIYRAIGESIPYGVWVCDPDGRNTYASPSLLDLLGITQAQCSEFGWGDSLHPEDAERTIAAWKECVRTEGVWDIEHRFRGTDGKYHPILARGVPVRNEDGKLIAWAGINLDIGSLKQVEEELRLAHQRFELALKNSPIVVSTQDRDLRYTWIYNPARGLDAEQIIGKTDEELADPQDVAELVACKRAVLETGIAQRREFVVSDPEGTTRTYDATIEALHDRAGTITGLTTAFSDITESKRRQERIQESQMRIELRRRLLDQREQERAALAREVHDGPVQTLAALNMELDLARTAADNPAVRRELGHIQRDTRRAMQELRTLVGELRSSLLQGVGVSRAIRLHGEDFGRKHPELQITWHVAPDRGRLGAYGSLAIFRIYQEALSNVAKHARATRARIRLSFANDCAVLEVKDNGKGMEGTTDLMEQTARGHYGLAGMQERTDAVNGELKLVSKPDKGTTLIVSIPLEKAAAGPRGKA